MIFEYKTINSPVTDVILKEKGSKFIGYAFHANDLQEVRQQLETVREQHPKATHHCYAFRLGLDGSQYRANDDGEPSGSAGIPIYNQLLANELTNILLVVVRYYGGTKLGVSGLVKAYKETAKTVLESSVIVVKELENTLMLKFPFSLQNGVFTMLNKINAKVISFASAEQCSITAKIKTSQKENIPELLSGMHQVYFEILD